MTTQCTCGRALNAGRSAGSGDMTRCLICETEEIMTHQAHPPSVDQQLTDARTATENAQALANHHEATVKAQREEIAELEAGLMGTRILYKALLEALREAEQQRAVLLQERRALCDVLSADSSTVAGQTLVEALKAVIAERDAARTLAASEAVRVLIHEAINPSHDHWNDWVQRLRVAADRIGVPTCVRCGTPLDNVSPGVSVVAGGVRVCTPCLRPGETEVARARGLT